MASPELGAEVRSVLRKVLYGVHERNLLSVGATVVTARFNRDGTRIAALDTRGTITIWDRGRRLAEFPMLPNSLGGTDLFTNGRFVAAFTADLDFLVAIVPSYSENGEMIRKEIGRASCRENL